MAKMLFRTFVSRHAQLPINISGELRSKIETRFKGGYVGKNVFDEGLVEVYNMMQNGPFYRFVRSKAFTDYANTQADFAVVPEGALSASGPNTMAISPMSDPTDSDISSQLSASNNSRSKFNVYDYVHNL